MYGLIVVLTMLALCSIVFAGELTGPAKVVSTDTLEIHGTRVRLWGIDAPDKTQMCQDINVNPYRCGLRAASDLERFIAEREVSCLSVLENECGRTMATFQPMASISENGWCVMVSCSIGRNTPGDDTTLRNARPIVPDWACGRAALPYLGYIERAFG